MLGDTHGSSWTAARAVRDAVAHGARHIVQVGDFGYWPHKRDGIRFLDEVNAAATEAGVQFVWLDGNHENFDALEGMVPNTAKNDKGMSMLRSNLLYSPRGNSWTWDDQRFMTVGGAVSVDKALRLMEECGDWVDRSGRLHNGSGARTLWWPQERTTDADVEHAAREAQRKPVDYLFTHDCSDQTPFRYRLKEDPDSKDNRRKIDELLNRVAPRWHFHGHMHTRYAWDRPIPDGAWDSFDETSWTHVRGLECDGMWYNWGILDTRADTFRFRGEDDYNPLMEQLGDAF